MSIYAPIKSDYHSDFTFFILNGASPELKPFYVYTTGHTANSASGLMAMLNVHPKGGVNNERNRTFES